MKKTYISPKIAITQIDHPLMVVDYSGEVNVGQIEGDGSGNGSDAAAKEWHSWKQDYWGEDEDSEKDW